MLILLMLLQKPPIEESPIQFSKKDVECLQKNIFHEAGIEKRIGKLAVAQVTLNRLEDGRWGKTICEVVKSPKQFSWTSKKHKKEYGPLWKESAEVIEDIFKGKKIKKLDNALFYHNISVKPKWDGLKKITKLGNHVFYEERKN